MSDARTHTSLCCEHDERRDAVRALDDRFGLDYVELSDDGLALHVYFLGALPPELCVDEPDIERHLRLEGGDRVRDIAIVDVDPVVDPDETVDDFLLVRLDRVGDFSTYTLRLVDVAGADPAFDRAELIFHIDCPRDLDCLPACSCVGPRFEEPQLNYLARDYASLRQLILDRMALLVPDWTERHVPDIGITLVELLAYVGDYLSYEQDAVATEAYLDTARQRISVRRHARLVDYALHEGCNARAWVCVEVGEDIALSPRSVTFVTGLGSALASTPTVLEWPALADVPADAYEAFEPLVADRDAPIELRAAHNELHFYTWGDGACCLERGSTSATLLDAWVPAPAPEPGDEDDGAGSDDSYGGKGQVPATDYEQAPDPPPGRALRLAPGDVLIFEEVVGPKTGLAADADPAKRHAVRLTAVTADEDPVVTDAEGRPTPVVRIEWAVEDALPFTFCISVVGPPPACRYLDNVSVARGNVILADHGKTAGPAQLGPVPTLYTAVACECIDQPGDVETVAGLFRPALAGTPLTFRAPLADGPQVAASALLHQDVRATRPDVQLTSGGERWEPRFDLLDSRPGERHFCVEIDNDGVAHLRFGNGELGVEPAAGSAFEAVHRLGNGSRGNVGAESIARLVLDGIALSGISMVVRNPLPAVGGTEPEPVAQAKLFAPRAFRKRLERAIVAADYDVLAQRNPALQRASTRLTWIGSWYEADVAVDPLGSYVADDALLAEVEGYLHRYRRMGHDLSVRAAEYVPLDIGLRACVLPHYQRAHVKAALLEAFGDTSLPSGATGAFHPDKLTFGQSVYVSRIVAAGQRVPGVECLTVTRLQRWGEAPNHELRDGVLALRSWEIAQVDNDPNHPERGRLEITVIGGR
jgi:hypothetical protein